MCFSKVYSAITHRTLSLARNGIFDDRNTNGDGIVATNKNDERTSNGDDVDEIIHIQMINEGIADIIKERRWIKLNHDFNERKISEKMKHFTEKELLL